MYTRNGISYGWQYIKLFSNIFLYLFEPDNMKRFFCVLHIQLKLSLKKTVGHFSISCIKIDQAVVLNLVF